MGSWIQRVFKKGSGPAAEVKPSPAAPLSVLPLYGEDAEPDPEARRVVYAPLLADGAAGTVPADGPVPVSAVIARDGASCRFTVGVPLLRRELSFHFDTRSDAAGRAPLAEALFDVEGVDSVLLHGDDVIIFSRSSAPEQWEVRMRAVARQIRDTLGRGVCVVSEEVLARIPSEEELRRRVARVIDEEINPGIAAHSGVITLEAVRGNSVYIRMGGGCQGCAASEITLRQGIDALVREKVPEVGAIIDVTDHAAGRSPYFR